MKKSNNLIKISTCLLMLLLMVGFLGYFTASPVLSSDNLKVALIADVGGFGDQAYNDATLEGVKWAEEEFGIEYIAVEPSQLSDYGTYMRSMVMEGAELIIANSAAMEDVVITIAQEFPEVNFLILDSDVDHLANVMSVAYREEEASFLMGAFQAMMTKTDKIGFIAGMRIPVLERFSAGMKAGAKTINPDVNIFVSFTGTFSDVGAGKETASSMFDQGIDFISAAAGGANLGVFQAADERGGDNYVGGAATGQFHLMPNRIIASQVKLVNHSVYNVVEMAYQDKFEGGLNIFGLEQNGVDLAYSENEELAKLIPEKVKETIEKLRKDIISGNIVPPKTEEELSDFIIPELDYL